MSLNLMEFHSQGPCRFDHTSLQPFPNRTCPMAGSQLITLTSHTWNHDARGAVWNSSPSNGYNQRVKVCQGQQLLPCTPLGLCGHLSALSHFSSCGGGFNYILNGAGEGLIALAVRPQNRELCAASVSIYGSTGFHCPVHG